MLALSFSSDTLPRPFPHVCLSMLACWMPHTKYTCVDVVIIKRNETHENNAVRDWVDIVQVKNSKQRQPHSANGRRWNWLRPENGCSLSKPLTMRKQALNQRLRLIHLDIVIPYDSWKSTYQPQTGSRHTFRSVRMIEDRYRLGEEDCLITPRGVNRTPSARQNIYTYFTVPVQNLGN